MFLFYVIDTLPLPLIPLKKKKTWWNVLDVGQFFISVAEIDKKHPLGEE